MAHDVAGDGLQPVVSGDDVILPAEFPFEFLFLFAIEIGGRACGAAAWQNDNLARCVPVPDLVGRKNVSVLVANRTDPFTWLAEEGLLELRCGPGLWRRSLNRRCRTPVRRWSR
jgi:hypothetical protein